jgi:hypothetical protein
MPKLKGPGPGRIPDLDKLVDKSPAQIIRTLERFGLEPDVREMTRVANRVFDQQLAAVLGEKGIPDRDTWNAIDAQIERALTSSLRTQTKRAIHQYRKEQLRGVAKKFVWIAVGKGSCSSCETRHGQSRTMREWELAGEPGSAVLLCKQECRCSLQPDLLADEESDLIEEAVNIAIEDLRKVSTVK